MNFLQITDEDGVPRMIALDTITEIFPHPRDSEKTLIRRGKMPAITAAITFEELTDLVVDG